MEQVTFGAEDIEKQLAQLSPTEIDQLPFGSIKVDRLGTILEYNATEAGIAHRDRREVLGKNFFTEVAPCAQSPEFYGAFVEGVKAGKLNKIFHYTLEDDRFGSLPVKVQMKGAISGDGGYWIFVKRL